MALRLAYLAFGALLRLLARRRSVVALAAEVMILRHELAVLRRSAPKPRSDWADRALIAALAGVISPRRRRGFVVTPATIMRWHHALADAGATPTSDQADHRSTTPRAR